MSSHDRFRSIYALSKTEAYLVDHNEEGNPTKVVDKRNFNSITKNFITNSYNEYESSFKRLAEQHLETYLKDIEEKIDLKTRTLVLKELTSDYMSEVEILPTTVFNDFCGIAVAGSISRNVAKYAEILTLIKENSIH